jgi:DNA-binding SARP family transcriptional activator
MRVYLTGSVGVEYDGRFVSQQALPGAQGRLVFAMLALERERAMPVDELADELWGETPPRAWDVAIRAIVSKLRSALAPVELDGTGALVSALGCYQLRLPPTAWVDVEAAADAAHRAERDLRDGRAASANGWTLVAASIARRAFLPGMDGPWTERRRKELQRIRVRTLECRAEIEINAGDHELAVRDLEEVIALEPFRESSFRLLMLAHLAEGNRAEALRVYEKCRLRLVDELGTTPSPDIESLHLDVLRAD